jgi:rubrerythrin
MDREERLDALKVALNNEMRERDFYLQNAERTTNPAGKAMFQNIADDENEHYHRLNELHEKWAAEEKWPETVPLKVKETVVRDVLKDFLKQSATMPKGDDNDLEAIRTAINFEERGVAHYSKLRDSVTNEKEKQFFDLLVKMEHEHYLSLKDTEEFLIDPADWYRKHEHHTLDGA